MRLRTYNDCHVSCRDRDLMVVTDEKTCEGEGRGQQSQRCLHTYRKTGYAPSPSMPEGSNYPLDWPYSGRQNQHSWGLQLGFMARCGGDVSPVVWGGGSPPAAIPKWSRRGFACQPLANRPDTGRDIFHNIRWIDVVRLGRVLWRRIGGLRTVVICGRTATKHLCAGV